jgi:serine/threonine protein kinase
MEFVEGKSLLSLMGEEAIGQQDAVRLIAGVLHGLAHLRSRRILHRDLKPANIVVAANGTPKIADFGSVALLPEGQVGVTASKHSALYVPPEASNQQTGYTFESDLYQVGIVLYELVNGPLQYDLQHYLSPKWLEKLRRKGSEFDLSDNCDRPQAADAVLRCLAESEKLLGYGRPPKPYFSPQVRKIVTKACKAKLSDRFRTAQEFCARLMQVSVPNWKTHEEHTVRASEWNGWDWEVANNGHLVVKKSRPNQNAYRHIRNQQFAQPRDAFEFVEFL